MSVTTSDIVTEYGEFSSLTESQIQSALTYASLKCHEFLWGTLLDEAIKTLTAHELFIKYAAQLNLGTTLKAIQTGETIQLSGWLKGSTNYYMISPYGQKYLSMLNELSGVSMRVL